MGLNLWTLCFSSFFFILLPNQLTYRMFVKRFYMHSKTFITVLKQRQWKKLTINHMRTLWYVCFITGTEHKALPSSLMITLYTQHEWHMSAFLLLFQAHLCSGSQIQRKEPHRGGFWTRDIMCFLSISSPQRCLSLSLSLPACAHHFLSNLSVQNPSSQ